MRAHRLLPVLIGLFVIGALVTTQLFDRSPSGRRTLIVSSGRAVPVEPKRWYFHSPLDRVVSVPDSGRFVFPDDPGFRLFSREGVELPARFDVSWRLTDEAPAIRFALDSEEGSFERNIVMAGLGTAARRAAGALSAAAIYETGGRALVDAVHREASFPVGVEVTISLADLPMSDAVRQAIAAEGAGGHRVLLIGVDALDWKILEPLRAQGLLPVIDRLIRGGSRADLTTLTPMLSPLIWTSMATGVGPERHGILDFLMTDPVTGARVPVTSRLRKVPAFWNVATQFGRTTDVVAWLATWPAETVRGRIVTDRFGFLAYAAGASSGAPTADMVFPPELLERARSLTLPPAGVEYEDIDRFLNVTREEFEAARQGGFQRGNLINNLLLTWATAETYRRIGVSLLEDRPDLSAVYFEYIDAVCHLFMPYAAPRQPHVTESEFRRYGDAVRAACIDMDRMIGTLVEAAGDSTVILVASDHGFLSGAARPVGSAAIEEGTAARWHRDPGVLILAGPGIRRNHRLESASVLDVTPTLLHMAGLPVSEEMEGRVLVEALDPEEIAARPVRRVPRFELSADVWAPPAEATGTARPADPALAAADSAAALVNLGLVLENQGRLPEAEAAYRRALAGSPDNPNAANNLGNILQKTGRLDGAIEIFTEIVRKRPDYVPAWHNLGLSYMARDEPAAALPFLDKAVALEPGNVSAQINRGHARLRLGRIPEAILDFRKALQQDPDAVNAHFGLGLAAARQGNIDEARREFARTLELDPRHGSARENLELLK